MTRAAGRAIHFRDPVALFLGSVTSSCMGTSAIRPGFRSASRPVFLPGYLLTPETPPGVFPQAPADPDLPADSQTDTAQCL